MKTTFKVLNEKFLKLQLAYNEHQAKFPDIINQYAPEFREEKRQLHLQTGVNLHKPQFENLKIEVQSTIRTNMTDKNKLKFPLRFSDNSSDRLIGEQKLTNARLLFAQFKESPDVLAGELRSLIDSNDRDSAFSLIDVVSLSTGDARTGDMQKFNFIKDTFYQNSGIQEIDNELNSLQILEGQINDVVAALNDGTPYIILPFQAAAMPDEDFFNLQNKLRDQFGDFSFQKIKQFAS